MLLHSSFSPESVALMGRVCDAAWREVQVKFFFPFQSDAEAIRRELADVMAAVAGGERDPVRFRAIAVEGVSQWH